MLDATHPKRPRPRVPRAQPPRQRFLRSWGAWLVGVPLGLVLGAPLALLRPSILLPAFTHYTADQDWRIAVDDAVMDYGHGWSSPRTWRWHVTGLTILHKAPHRPTMFFDEMYIAPPRLSWSPDGWVITIPSASVNRFDMHFEEVARQDAPPPVASRRLTLVLEQLEVAHFGMTMRKGHNPEVIVEATHATLEGPFWAKPFQRKLAGKLATETAWAEVAGIRFDDIEASRIAFTGLGFEVDAATRVGVSKLDAELQVLPLIGPPQITMTARIHETSMNSLSDAILGVNDMQFIGRIAATATLTAGGKNGPGSVSGHATVNVRDSGFSQAESAKPGLAMAVRLAPFLHFDDDGNIVVGDFHGDVSFTEKGVTFGEMIYEAPHSVGELHGYVRSTGISAMLHFTPRPGSLAIAWGLILRGDLRKPKVALALPAVLNRWTPCSDPHNCGLSGGPTPAEEEAADEEEAALADLEREARAAAASDRRDERKAARVERRAAR